MLESLGVRVLLLPCANEALAILAQSAVAQPISSCLIDAYMPRWTFFLSRSLANTQRDPA